MYLAAAGIEKGQYRLAARAKGDVAGVAHAARDGEGVMAFQLENTDALLLAQDEKCGGLAGVFAQLLEDGSCRVDLVQPREPDYEASLHHAVRQPEALRIAFRLDQPGRGQGLQQTVHASAC